MSDQEMQFADPAWRPPQQRSTNLTTPPVQPQEQPLPLQEDAFTNSYTEGYQARQAQQPGNIPLRPQSRQRRRFGPAFWLLLAFLLLVLIGGISYANPFEYQVPGNAVYAPASKFQLSPDTQHYSVAIHPTISITNPIGSIHVHTGGSVNDVSVTITDQGFVQRETTRGNDGSINITVEDTDPSVHSDIDVTVADEADLVLSTTSGDIEVTGVSGQLSLTSESGAITLSQVTLTRDSSVKTDTGAIIFDGAIDPHGSYQFEADSGMINVTLPANSAFRLDVSTNAGDISSDYPGLQGPLSNVSSSGEAHVNVGNPPRATISLKTNTGSITVHKA